ncbi:MULTISPECIES: hypothetical protein [Zoogloea]|jgi:hypothetical protein|uniref:Uncharacterized protein n=1 Tax=Zoogloea oleivorans TaxID=1552750 RepID=A0A6C2CMT7_9RHOO|nr:MULTISPECIES: hypothetical protein [Zoogloea]MDD2667719.1 hypothetical protein [Zoogloea sp.]MDY0036239.1 hypothetical protein [Zoogloea oleivorans]TYC54976.1 hypothetical protein ETQ85_16125 [Zoogloea oleivorans]
MKVRTAVMLSLAFALGACNKNVPKLDIPFASWDKSYQSKMDLAQVEYKYPIPTVELGKVTPEYLATLDQEQLDQIYARLTAGPIPDGAFDGRILLSRGGSGKFRLSEIVGGFTGLGLHLKGLVLEDVGEALWRGKVFYRQEGVLRNRIEDLGVLKKMGLVQGEPKKMDFNGKQTWLLFPAKLYCGQSLLDARRESIIIDYFFTDEIPGYQENPDYLAGRRGLRVRDEIRMIRPGFYLGRAYLDKGFALNFTLYNKDMDAQGRDAFVKTGQVQEDCWSGTQARKVLAAAGG